MRLFQNRSQDRLKMVASHTEINPDTEFFMHFQGNSNLVQQCVNTHETAIKATDLTFSLFMHSGASVDFWPVQYNKCQQQDGSQITWQKKGISRWQNLSEYQM